MKQDRRCFSFAVMYGRPLSGKEFFGGFGISVWSGHVSGLLLRSS
jgi:hypothetical protein